LTSPTLASLRILVSLILLAAPATRAFGQQDFFSNWFDRVTRTQAAQPHWITPMFTVTPRLEEEFRFDILRQSVAGGNTTANYDGGKGLELIPTEHTEIIFNLPPYLAHTSPARDGFGDVSFLFKCRILAGNEEHGNYILTAFLGASVPTGEYKNGAPHAVITPTIAAGKGYGPFSVQSTFGVGVPVDDAGTLGTPLAWNTAFQYHLLRKLWPEIETNATFWANGPNAGKKQVFLSPGLVVGRIHLWRRLGFAIGGGVQIAATQYHQYNHQWSLSVRFPF